MTETLKPCPFCGNTDYLDIIHMLGQNLDNDEYVLGIKCNNDCGCRYAMLFDNKITHNQAVKILITAWNTRAYEQEVKE